MEGGGGASIFFGRAEGGANANHFATTFSAKEQSPIYTNLRVSPPPPPRKTNETNASLKLKNNEANRTSSALCSVNTLV